MSEQKTLVVLTALDVEHQSVRDKLTDVQVQSHRAGTRFEVGRLADCDCRVALALVGKGNHAAAVLAERAISEFDPAALLLVGVAGALRPSIALGDVVMATHVYAYHSGTSQDGGLKARPRVWEVSHRTQQFAQHLKRTGEWARQLPPDAERPDVVFGPIAAGEIVQDSAVSAEARGCRCTWTRQPRRVLIQLAGTPSRQSGRGRVVTERVPKGRGARTHSRRYAPPWSAWLAVRAAPDCSI